MSKQPSTNSYNSGVPFEWAIVYWSLFLSGKQTEIEKRQKQFPKLKSYGEEIDKLALLAIEQIKKNNIIINSIVHSNELNLGITPEPKTDILLNEKHKISVKLNNNIQLSSAEGKYTYLMFNKVLNSIFETEPKLKEKIKTVNKSLQRIENMPIKMIDPLKIKTAMKKSPHITKDLMVRGKLLKQYNWEKWVTKNKKRILYDIYELLDKIPGFRYKLIEEVLTGKQIFGENSLASAEYILTPNSFKKIDKKYIKNIMYFVRIALRAKSRHGIASATIRFEMTNI